MEALEGEIMPDAPAAPSAADRPSPAGALDPALLSCHRCHGHDLTLRGEVVQCDDCGAIQPTGGGKEKR